MTTQQQLETLQSKRLILTKSRTIRHYLDCILVSGLCLFILYLIIKGFIEKTGAYNSPNYLFFLIFPAMALTLFYKQYRSLGLKEFVTGFSRQDNYNIVKKTLQNLKWNIKVDNDEIIEAYTNSFGFWTWTDQMISIIITDDKILLNSICNVDTYATQSVSWGQNSRNIKKFEKEFHQSATMHIS